jgi:hypothetical protein
MDDSYYCLIVRPLCFDWIEFAAPKFAFDFRVGSTLQILPSNITILNRNHQNATQITNGDIIQIQIMLIQALMLEIKIDFEFAREIDPQRTWLTPWLNNLLIN